MRGQHKKLAAFIFILIFSALSFFGYHKMKTRGSDGKLEVYNLHQVVTADSSVSRTIMWQASSEYAKPLVEYREEGKTQLLQAPALSQKFTDADNTSYVYTVELGNLQPGKIYDYRIGYGDDRGLWHKLQTSLLSTFEALIFTDPQSASYSGWKSLVRTAVDKHPKAELVLMLGDLVDNGEDAQQWHDWFSDISPLAENYPIAPVLGNHETYTLDWKVRMPEAYLHFFVLPKVEPARYQNQFYSFDYGDVHFMVLNDVDNEMKAFQPDMQKDQIEWLRKDAASTKKKWKVVMVHKDFLQYSFLTRKTPRPEGFSHEGKVYMPLMDELGIDVVLSGHLHTYRRRVRLRDFKPDPQGTLYLMCGLAGDVRYDKLWKRHKLDQYVAPQPETDNYLTMKLTPGSMTFNCYLPDGKKIDSVTLRK